MATAARQAAFRLTQNVTLIGPPGSGKGYYGRLLSAAWHMAPLYSASRILRSSSEGPLRPDDPLNSGTLVDCAVVARRILTFLQERHPVDDDGTNGRTFTRPPRHFLMDGFPRTRRQIQLMTEEWPEAYQITHAIHLQIPDHVCRAKMMGRRICTLCQGEPNAAHVQDPAGFWLPPTRPPHCQTELCQPDRHWQTRADDVDETIVQKRLLEYRCHEPALLEYYDSAACAPDRTTLENNTPDATDNDTPRSNVCSITPYRGILDFPQVQRTLEHWL
jgi:adenylate kinase